MTTRPYAEIDVFTDTPYLGNALAVVVDADGMDAAQMARFAAWTNLSETAFLLPPTVPGADYRVRIFTTETELPFAGHPTLGAAHAWLGAGGTPARAGTLVQECGAGLVEVRAGGPGPRGARRLALKAPPLVRTGPLEPEVLDRALRGLGLGPGDAVDHQWVANGPLWAGLLLADADAVLALEPDFAALSGLEVGVVGPHRGGPDAPADFEVRAFCPGFGMDEDPVTGSLNAGLAEWLIGSGRAPARYTVRQGTRLGRAGFVEASREPDGIWVAGSAVTCIEGTVLTD